VKHGVGDGNLLNFASRKDLPNLLLKVGPLDRPMKIIHNQEASTSQILSENVGFLGGELEESDLDGIKERVFENLFGGKRDVKGSLSHIQIRQSLDSGSKVDVGF